MEEIVIRALCFVGIIVLGIALRAVGFFKREDFSLISRIVIKITLTAAIVVNFNGRSFDRSMFILPFIGLGFGLLMMGVGYLINLQRPREARAFAALNSAGCNIGNFVLPFAQGFLGPVGVMTVCFFDAGNSFICLGGGYSIASMMKNKGGKFTLMPMLKALATSAPFVTYVIMIILCLSHIALPHPVIEYAGIIGDANAFLAMLMLGIGFRWNIERGKSAELARIILSRYLIAIAFALCAYFLTGFEREVREALVILFLAPIASAAPAFTLTLKGDYSLACTVNSISIVLSILLIVGSLVLMNI